MIMPRYRGTPRKFTRTIKIGLEQLDIERADAIARALVLPRTEAIRRAITDEYLSLLSSGAIDLTMQPVVQVTTQEAQP
jgi:hypothetical protein